MLSILLLAVRFRRRDFFLWFGFGYLIIQIRVFTINKVIITIISS